MDNHMIKLVKINDANRQEYERLERLYSADLSQYQSRIYPNEEKLLEWYYIVLDGRNIGSVWLEADENPHCAWLGIFIGENGCRGRGIGREVIGRLIVQEAKKRQLTKLYLHVREENLRAIRCYKAAGFQETDRYEKDGIRAITMMKTITERGKKMKAVCISASNVFKSGQNSTSYHLCEIISGVLSEREISCDIIDLREKSLSPCIGCGQCFESKRCRLDMAFNQIYEKLMQADYVFFVSPHYAPIPAKLCMLLEKMEQITFLHWWKDNSYQSEVYHIPTGIISHGGGSDWALQSYKAMVNDTIANALDTIQMKVVPYDDKWNTGISLPVKNVIQETDIFPVQEYDWDFINSLLREYIEVILHISDISDDVVDKNQITMKQLLEVPDAVQPRIRKVLETKQD